MIQPPPQSANPSPGLSAHPPRASANPRSIAIIVLAWLVLHIGCLFTPGLLDDVDSIYIEIARSMLLRHDYVTPMIDGIRFFDKPPLMYWLAAGSMHLFGPCDWAARLPLALLTLALLLATYALGLRLFAAGSPCRPPRPRRSLLRPRAGHLHRPLPLHPLLHPRHRHLPLDDARRPRLPHRPRPNQFNSQLTTYNLQLVSPPLPRLRRRHRPQPPHQGNHRPRLPHRLRPALSRLHPPAPSSSQAPSHPIHARSSS